MIGMSGMAARFETSILRQSQTPAIVSLVPNLDGRTFSKRLLYLKTVI